jgi:hypothetical protein
MSIIGTMLMLFGNIGILIFGIWILVIAFKESVLWGLGCIFVPFVALIFVAKNWEKTKGPFLGQLTCLVPTIAGSVLVM